MFQVCQYITILSFSNCVVLFIIVVLVDFCHNVLYFFFFLFLPYPSHFIFFKLSCFLVTLFIPYLFLVRQFSHVLPFPSSIPTNLPGLFFSFVRHLVHLHILFFFFHAPCSFGYFLICCHISLLFYYYY